MPSLIELSIPIADVRIAAMRHDPLTAADPGCAVKTWLQSMGIGLRPWSCSISGSAYRILGWLRGAPPQGDPRLHVGSRQVLLRTGDAVSLHGSIVPLRRSSFGGRRPLISRDAAAGRDDPEAAYAAWLRERLIGIQGVAEVTVLEIESWRHRRVLRKMESRSRGGLKKEVREQVIPVVTVSLCLTVRDPAALETWLSQGVGPHKAFGFGGFFPC